MPHFEMLPTEMFSNSELKKDDIRERIKTVSFRFACRQEDNSIYGLCVFFFPLMPRTDLQCAASGRVFRMDSFLPNGLGGGKEK
jgi:hypothetical protein